jgi:hypothetical protein
MDAPSAGVLTMRTTFVFGAGASLHAGYPLASTMGEALLDFMLKSSNPWQQDAARFLIDTFGKSPNIEDVITELQSRIDSLKEAKTSGGKAERMRLGNCRGHLGTSLREWFGQIHTKPAPAYAKFADKLLQPNDVVITFNSDDSLERELKRTGKWDISRGYGFPLGAAEHSSDVLMLKLHGSINWLVSLFGGARGGSTWVSSGGSSLGPYPVIHRVDLAYLGYQEFSGCTYQDGGAFPCLILPGRTKQFFYDTSSGNEYTEFWDLLWSQATEAVSRSDEIVLCGYSLLPVDERACDLLLQKPRKETHVLVVSGSQSARIADGIRTAGFRNVWTFKGGYFEDWVQQA